MEVQARWAALLGLGSASLAEEHTIFKTDTYPEARWADVLKGDIEKITSRVSIFEEWSLRTRLQSSILTFCKQKNVPYRRHFAFIMGAFLTLGFEEPAPLYNCFVSFVEQFAPRQLQDEGTRRLSDHLFLLLLRYHEPKLALHLEKHQQVFREVVSNWLDNAFANVAETDLVIALWDYSLSEKLFFNSYFFGLAILREFKAELLSDQFESITNVFLDDFGLLQKLCDSSNQMRLNSPPSFLTSLQYVIHPIVPPSLHKLLQSAVVTVANTDLPSSAVVLTPSVGTKANVFVLDWRPRKEFEENHAPLALNAPLQQYPLDALQWVKLLGAFYHYVKDRFGTQIQLCFTCNEDETFWITVLRGLWKLDIYGICAWAVPSTNNRLYKHLHSAVNQDHDPILCSSCTNSRRVASTGLPSRLGDILAVLTDAWLTVHPLPGINTTAKPQHPLRSSTLSTLPHQNSVQEGAGSSQKANQAAVRKSSLQTEPGVIAKSGLIRRSFETAEESEKHRAKNVTDMEPKRKSLEEIFSANSKSRKGNKNQSIINNNDIDNGNGKIVKRSSTDPNVDQPKRKKSLQGAPGSVSTDDLSSKLQVVQLNPESIPARQVLTAGRRPFNNNLTVNTRNLTDVEKPLSSLRRRRLIATPVSLPPPDQIRLESTSAGKGNADAEGSSSEDESPFSFFQTFTFPSLSFSFFDTNAESTPNRTSSANGGQPASPSLYISVPTPRSPLPPPVLTRNPSGSLSPYHSVPNHFSPGSPRQIDSRLNSDGLFSVFRAGSKRELDTELESDGFFAKFSEGWTNIFSPSSSTQSTSVANATGNVTSSSTSTTTVSTDTGVVTSPTRPHVLSKFASSTVSSPGITVLSPTVLNVTPGSSAWYPLPSAHSKPSGSSPAVLRRAGSLPASEVRQHVVGLWTSDLIQAESWFGSRTQHSRCALHYAEAAFLKALLTGQHEYMTEAVSRIEFAEQLAKKNIERLQSTADQTLDHQLKQEKDRSLEEIQNAIQLSQETRIHMVVLAECSISKAAVHVLLGNYIRSIVALRKSWLLYAKCDKYCTAQHILQKLAMTQFKASLVELFDTELEQDLSNSQNFGRGIFFLAMSMAPPSSLGMVKLAGFAADQTLGLQLLYECVSQREGVRGPFALLCILFFLLIYIPSFVDGAEERYNQAHHLIQLSHKRYPGSVIFQWVESYMKIRKGDFEGTVTLLESAIKSSLNMQLQHMPAKGPTRLLFELGLCYFLRCDWHGALHFFQPVIESMDAQSTDSVMYNPKALAMLCMGICEHMLHHQDQALAWYQRILDTVAKTKNDKWIIRRAEKFSTRKGYQLFGFEIMYLMDYFSAMTSTWLQQALYSMDELTLEPPEIPKKKSFLPFGKDKIAVDEYCCLLLLRGSALRLSGRLAEALHCLESALNYEEYIDVDQFIMPHVYYELALISIKGRDWKTAKDMLKRTKKLRNFDFRRALNFKVNAAEEYVSRELDTESS